MSAEPAMTAVAPEAPATAAPPRRGYVRWIVCILLLFATTINYIDRQVLGILAPTLQKEIGWTEVEYGYIVTAFQAAYSIGLLIVGRLLDIVGTKLGYAVSIVFWSLAAMATAFARTPFGFGTARFALGLGEAGNFPAAIKTVAEWFPKKERALATGIFNGGSNLGAIIAPAIVPFIALTWSWRVAFVITGAIGFVWLVAWLLIYNPPEKSKTVSKEELAYIRSDAEEAVTPVPLMKIIGLRQTWAFAIGKFLTDPIWWFYLYWLGKFLNEKHGVTLGKIGPPLIAIYVIADVGSIAGGWLSSRLMKNGWTANKARKTTMLICALLVVPVIFAPRVEGLWTAVLLISIAAAAHQGWSANIFTTASDMFPKRAIGSVVGFGGMAGSIGGMFVATGTGWILELTHSYGPVFVIAGCAYLVALGIIHAIVPRLEPANV